MDELSELSKKTNSVNTVFKKNNKVIGENTDVFGFTESIKHQSIDLKKRHFSLRRRRGCSFYNKCFGKTINNENFLMNRTFEKIKKLKENFPKIELLKWGEIVEFDIIINATSIGLKIDDKINLNLESLKRDKIL